MEKSFSVQYSELDQELGYHAGFLAGKLERLQAQLGFAKQLCSVNPDNAPPWSARVLEAGSIVNEGLRQPGGISMR